MALIVASLSIQMAAWGYFPAREAEAAEALLGQILAILWKMTRA
jgi:hypothetical protein